MQDNGVPLDCTIFRKKRLGLRSEIEKYCPGRKY